METGLFFVAVGALLIAAIGAQYFSHRAARRPTPSRKTSTLTVAIDADAGPALAELRRVQAQIATATQAFRDMATAAEGASQALHRAALELDDCGAAEDCLALEDADGNE